MLATRPPRTVLVRRQLIFFFLLTSALLSGQDLILPDLVVSRKSQPDISQPGMYTDPGEIWEPELPNYRRQYSLYTVHSPEPVKTVPGRNPAGRSTLSTALPQQSRIRTGLVHPQFSPWSAGLEADILEGSDMYLNASIPGFGNLGGIIFIPFTGDGPRPWSGEINWKRIEDFSADVRAGIKADTEITPYGTVHLDWNRGIGRPDSYYLDVYTYGFSNPGISGIGGTDLEFQLGDTNWSIFSGVEGGAWYSSGTFSGLIRGAIAAGVRLPDSKLSIKLGIDAAYAGDNLSGAPYFSVTWLPERNLSLFTDIGLNTGFTEAVDTVFRREKLNEFSAEIPINVRYRVGVIRSETGLIDYRFEFSYGYGQFTVGTDSIISTVRDRRIYGSTVFGYNFGPRRIELSGSWDFSIQDYPDIWESRLEFSGDLIALYISGGTQDAILAAFLPGIRGEQPIMGLGLDWIVNENWKLGAFTYASIPWQAPSLKLTIDWRTK